MYKGKLLQSYTLWLVIILALCMRLPLLNGSFWLDEAAQALEVTRPLSQQLNIIEDFQPPLLHLILHAAQYVSHTEWWLRTIGALLPGLGTIAVTYLLGKRLFNNQVALVASLLLATSSFHIFYSQELRPYALPGFVAVVSWLQLLGAPDAKFKWKYSVASFLGLLSSYLYPFVVLSQLGYVWQYRREQFKHVFFAIVMAGFGFLPWLPLFSSQLFQGGLIQTMLPGWSDIVAVPQLKSLPLIFGKFVYGVLDIKPTVLFILPAALLILALTSIGHTLYKKNQRYPTTNLIPLLYWLIIPITIAWVTSFFIPILQPKRVIFALPAWYLFVVAAVHMLLQKLPTAKSTWWHTIELYIIRLCIPILLIINCLSTYSYYTDTRLQRENWRDLHNQIVKTYPADLSVALFSFPSAFAPWRWYDDGSYPTLSSGIYSLQTREQAYAFIKPIMSSQYKYVLVFDYLQDLTDPYRIIPTTLQELGFEERGAIEYPNIGFVRIYTRNEAATAYEYRN